MSTVAQRVNEAFSKNKSKLTEREQEIVARYYGIGGELRWTLQELGNKLGVTKERVRQIKAAALIKIDAIL